MHTLNAGIETVFKSALKHMLIVVFQFSESRLKELTIRLYVFNNIKLLNMYCIQ